NRCSPTEKSMDTTNDPALYSFIPVAPESHFPIQNLPYGVFRRYSGAPPRIGVAIGDSILDLSVLQGCGLLGGSALHGQVFAQPTLNAFLALGRPAWREARSAINRLLRADEAALRDNAELRGQALLPMTDAEMLLPLEI